MKLTILQWSWVIATGAFFLAVLLDIFNIINIPGRVLIVVPILLILVSWFAGPSLKELNELARSNRRG